METSAKPVRDSYVRSKLSWSRIVLWGSLVSVLLFVPEDRNGCGFFRYGAMEFAHFGYVFAWMVIFFALRLRWRLLLLATTGAVLFPYFGLHGIAEENAGPEAAAVAGLRQYQSSLSAYHTEHQPEGYPESLPTIAVSPYEKFYTFKYVPVRETDGRIVGYLVQATPKRRECDFYWSFTITDDGKVFYTYEPRAATKADKILE